jgi:hypothetical protein
MKPQQVAFDMTIEDLMAYWRYVYRRNSDVRKYRHAVWIYCGVLIAIAAYMVFYLEGINTLHDNLRFVWAAALVLLGLVLLTAVMPQRLVLYRRQWYEREGHLALLGPCTVEIAPEGITWTEPSTMQKTAWWVIRNVEVTEDLVLLRADSSSACIIPARAFPDRWAMEQFAESAREFRARVAPPVEVA